jgi:hypothetical protein
VRKASSRVRAPPARGSSLARPLAFWHCATRARATVRRTHARTHHVSLGALVVLARDTVSLACMG